jgi:hypothetical protein
MSQQEPPKSPQKTTQHLVGSTPPLPSLNTTYQTDTTNNKSKQTIQSLITRFITSCRDIVWINEQTNTSVISSPSNTQPNDSLDLQSSSFTTTCATNQNTNSEPSSQLADQQNKDQQNNSCLAQQLLSKPTNSQNTNTNTSANSVRINTYQVPKFNDDYYTCNLIKQTYYKWISYYNTVNSNTTQVTNNLTPSKVYKIPFSRLDTKTMTTINYMVKIYCIQNPPNSFLDCTTILQAAQQTYQEIQNNKRENNKSKRTPWSVILENKKKQD